MDRPHQPRAAPERTPVEAIGPELRRPISDDAGTEDHRCLTMSIHALAGAVGEERPLVACGVPIRMGHILERLEVGRPFSFGEAVLNPDMPPGSLQGPSLALIAAWNGSLTISGSDGSRGRLDRSHCGLFLFDGDVRLYPNGAATTVAWCQTPIDAATAAGLTASPQIRISDQVRTLIRLGLDVRSLAPASHNARYRDAVGVAAVNAFSAEICGLASLPAIVRKAREHADVHFSEDCDLSLLAAVAGVTREHLTTAFRKHVGMTPVRYLWSVRARNAARLILSSGLNLSMIAEQCGYKSPYHLSREIKRLTGMSPRDMRREDSGL